MKNNLSTSKREAWGSAFFIFLSSLIGFTAVGPLIGFFVAAFFSGADVSVLQKQLQSPDASTREAALIVQGCATLVGLIATPFFYLKAFPTDGYRLSSPRTRSDLTWMIGAAGVATVLFIAPNSILVEWNERMTLPGFLSGFENWARDMEQKAKEITAFFISFDSFGEFLIVTLIIAVLPGIGEEFVFRGLLQPRLQRATGNAHLGIAISAILFSAIHMQFFGFFPRMALGILFGYLYHWSGHLAVPMAAHFFNNGFAVSMVYLHRTGWVSFDVESEEAMPVLPALFCAIIIFVLLRAFRDRCTKQMT